MDWALYLTNILISFEFCVFSVLVMLRRLEQTWRLRQRLSVQTSGHSCLVVSPYIDADGIHVGEMFKIRRGIHSSMCPAQPDASGQSGGVKVCVVGSGPAGFYAVDKVKYDDLCRTYAVQQIQSGPDVVLREIILTQNGVACRC